MEGPEKIGSPQAESLTAHEAEAQIHVFARAIKSRTKFGRHTPIFAYCLSPERRLRPGRLPKPLAVPTDAALESYHDGLS